MRKWISLFEGATPSVISFWYNPKTKEVMICGDHGGAVAQDPSKFGIESSIVVAMKETYGSWYDDGYDTIKNSKIPTSLENDLQGSDLTGWYADDIWEILAINRGWVRCGTYSRNTAAYLAAANAKAAWFTAKYMLDSGGIGNQLDVEIINKMNSATVILSDSELEVFIRSGPNKAEQILMRHND